LKNLVIIPARAGSKRLPGKNKKFLGGIPLIEHSVNYASLNSDIIDKIIVSTDDPEVKGFGLSKSIQFINRPACISGDKATTLSALQHVLENINETYDFVILLQPTNPLRPKNLLIDCWKTILDTNSESLFTVSRNYRKFGKIENDNFKPFNYTFGQRSQELEPLYYENGLLYIAKADMIKNGKLMDENSFPYLVDHPFAEVDIDEQVDFDYAEFLMNRIDNQ